MGGTTGTSAGRRGLRAEHNLVLVKVTGVVCAVRGHTVGQQARCVHQDRRCKRYAWVRVEGCFDLGKLDAHSPELELAIAPTQKVKRAVAPTHREVSRAKPPQTVTRRWRRRMESMTHRLPKRGRSRLLLARPSTIALLRRRGPSLASRVCLHGAGRILKKARRTQLGPPMVPMGHELPTRLDLPNPTEPYMHLSFSDGPAKRTDATDASSAARRRHLVAGARARMPGEIVAKDIRRDLRGSVQIQQLCVGQQRTHAHREGQRQRIATHCHCL